MPGGIFELVAKGIEDFILTKDPSISFFKTIYRRHTNFSLEDYRLNFRKSMNFGDESIVKLEKNGDLIHKIYLVIELPTIICQSVPITKKEVIALLKSYGMTIVFPNSNSQITDSDIILIRNVVANFVIILQTDIAKYLEFQTLIDTTLNPTVHPELLSLDTQDYITYIKDTLMSITDQGILYKYLQAVIEDDIVPTTVLNWIQLKKLIMTNISDIIISVPSYDGYLEPIYQFISNIEFASYSLSVSPNMLIIFSSVLDYLYNSPSEYSNLDPYKTFIKYFDTITKDATSDNDITQTKLTLLSTIYSNLLNNIVLLNTIFEVLSGSNVPYYKRYKISGSTSRETQKYTNLITAFTSSTYLFDKLVTPESLHFYGIYVQEKTQLFFTDLLNVLNSNYMDKYIKAGIISQLRQMVFSVIMPDISLLNSTKISQMVYMNFIPLMTMTDILTVTTEYMNYILTAYSDLADISGTLYAYYVNAFDDISTYLQNIHDTIYVIVYETIIPTTVELQEIIANAVRINTTDTIIYINFKIYERLNNMSVMDYIKTNYITVVDHIASILPLNSTVYENTRRDRIRTDIQAIILSYFTLQANIPDYTTYKETQHNRIYDYGNTNTDVCFDVFSSYWYNIQNTYQTSYNILFNTILSESYFNNELGVEMYKYISDIIFNTTNILESRSLDSSGGSYLRYKSEDSLSTTPIDYYLFTQDILYGEPISIYGPTATYDTLQTIYTYINEKQTFLEDLNTTYQKYKLLFNGRHIFLADKHYLFTNRDDVTTTFYNIIVGNIRYGYGKGYDSELTQILQIALNNVINTSMTQDIIIGIRDTFIELLNDILTSHFSFGAHPEVYNWYITEVLPLVDRSILLNMGLSFFNKFIPGYIYNLVLDLPNSLSVETLLIDELIKENKYVYYLTNLLTTNNTVQSNYDLLHTSVVDIIAQLNTTLEAINRPDINSEYKLVEFINESRQIVSQNYSWVDNLGYALIDEIEIEINGQKIDKHTGEFMYLYNRLSYGSEKDNSYIIGNTPDLTTYDITNKIGRKLYIPLEFWFCRNETASIPIVALLHSDIWIRVKLTSLDKLIKKSNGSVLLNTKLKSCYILTQYIFIEKEERKAICTKKHEQLIENIQIIDVLSISSQNFQYNIDNKPYFDIRLDLREISKELIWVIKLYDTEVGKQFDYIDGIFKTELMFNNRQRDTVYGQYSNLVVSNQYHKTSIPSGVYVYTFSIYPTQLQPSGIVNMSKLEDIRLRIYPSDHLYDLLQNGTVVRMTLYSVGYNILRIMSGLSGLVFYTSHN